MTELAELLPKTSMTVQAIFDAYKKAGDAEPPRKYLGCSELGHVCTRYLWYKYRGMCRSDFSGRMYRLFETGNEEEIRLGNDLVSIGCEVHLADEKGNQFAVSALDGKLSGHLDGCALGVPEAPKTWHVLEFKTHNAKSFTKLLKEGVAKAKPQHYCQMMLYMGLTGMTRALYLAKNKDTDDLYSERVRFSQFEFDALMDRAWHIINDEEPPERISTRQDYFECSWCDAKGICWNQMLQTAKELFCAVPTSVSNDDILLRYPESDCRVVFKGPIGLLRVEWQRLYSEDIQTIEPIASGAGLNYRAAEFPCIEKEGGACGPGRAVIVWTEMTQIGSSNCEIRESVE